MLYAVTRQCQWPDGDCFVQISRGGLNYIDPNVLSPRYAGEFETYHDPRKAAEAAIHICLAWRKDGQIDANIEFAFVYHLKAYCKPVTFQEVEEWAREEYKKLPKCEGCGELLPKNYYALSNSHNTKFCAKDCAAHHYALDLTPAFLRQEVSLRAEKIRAA